MRNCLCVCAALAPWILGGKSVLEPQLCGLHIFDSQNETFQLLFHGTETWPPGGSWDLATPKSQDLRPIFGWPRKKIFLQGHVFFFAPVVFIARLGLDSFHGIPWMKGSPGFESGYLSPAFRRCGLAFRLAMMTQPEEVFRTRFQVVGVGCGVWWRWRHLGEYLLII